MRLVAKTPRCEISTAIMVDAAGREVDPFDLRYYEAIERLHADPSALRRPFPCARSAFRSDEDADDAAADEQAVFQGGAGDGIFLLAHYGSGIFAFLVVTGEQFGTVWVNDRTNGLGIGHVADYVPTNCFAEDPEGMSHMPHGGPWRKPGPHSFAEWYEDWLDTSLELAARA
jgi:hypothetical protein